MKFPIVYDDLYNISFFGLENFLHSFDGKKYGKVFWNLAKKFNFKLENCYHPTMVTDDELLKVHSKSYLNNLSSSSTIARIAEVPLIYILPVFLLQSNLLNPIRLATGGTILASQLALKHGWSINLGGGFHHSKYEGGEGFCFFADIPLAIQELLTNKDLGVNKVLIVDLDAHQGNGYQSIFHIEEPTEDNIDKNNKENIKSYYKTNIANNVPSSVDIYDVYNCEIYPSDRFAQQFITYKFPLFCNTKDEEYLKLLKNNLPNAINKSKPDIIFYNAGTDIFENDPLGHLKITKQGIIVRDEIVFRNAREKNIPIVMVLSGGYTKESADIITDSIINLAEKGLIQLVE
jgi:histone deacetylase 11